MLWIRCFFGLLSFDVVKTPRTSGKADHQGLVAVWHVNIYLRKKFGNPSDPDHVVLEAYCGLTADGRITGSGLMDPKDIVIDALNYCQLSKAQPVCGICQGGDMIPFEERFMNAPYAPPTPPLSDQQKRASLRRKDCNRKWDLFEQGLVLKKHRSKMQPQVAV